MRTDSPKAPLPGGRGVGERVIQAAGCECQHHLGPVDILECAGEAARANRTLPTGNTSSVFREFGCRRLPAPRRRRFPLATMPGWGRSPTESSVAESKAAAGSCCFDKVSLPQILRVSVSTEVESPPHSKMRPARADRAENMDRPLLSGYGAFEAVLSEASSRAPNPTYTLLTLRAVGRESVAHPAINGGMRPRTYRLGAPWCRWISRR